MDKWDEEKLRSTSICLKSSIQAWESTASSSDSRPSIDLFPTSKLPIRSYASILSRASTQKREEGPAHRSSARRPEFQGTCVNQHALPPGFVLKSQKKAIGSLSSAGTRSFARICPSSRCPFADAVENADCLSLRYLGHRHLQLGHVKGYFQRGHGVSKCVLERLCAHML